MTEVSKCLEFIENQSEIKTVVRRKGEIPRDQVRSLFVHSNESKNQVIRNVEINIPEEIKTEFTRLLRGNFSDFIEPNSDRIGIANFLNIIVNPDFMLFADSVAKATILLGQDKVEKYLNDWRAGTPIYFKEKVHLVGITVNEPLQITEDLYISSPENPEKELPSAAYSFNFPSLPYPTKCYGSILTINWMEKPSLFKPDTSDALNDCKNRQQTLVNESVEDFDFISFIDSLALSCNCYVRFLCRWYDLGDLEAFWHGYYGVAHSSIPVNTYTHKNISAEDIKRVIGDHKKCQFAKENVAGFSTGLQRWIQSLKQDDPFSDRYIDLRIALESLYLNDSRGSLKFRLASRLAWHLGRSLDERIEIYDDISKFYSQASQLVHAKDQGAVTTELKKKYEDDLVKVQDHFRNALLSPLNYEHEDWKRLILGGVID